MKNTIFLLVLLTTVISCKKDFLETSPTNSLDDAAVFTTTANANNVINGIYRYLYSRFDQQNQPGQGGVMLLLDFMGEDIHQAIATWYTAAGSGTGGWITHRNDQSGYVNYPFRLYYRCIGNANAIIANVDNSVGTQADKNRLKAEALSMRAWSYFNLVQIFGKRYDSTAIPNTQLGVSMPLDPKDIQLPRSTVEQVYAQINKDLNDAVTLFSSASAPVNKSHLSLRATYAIIARVALTQQYYHRAAQFAQQVISLGGSSLMTNAEYQAGFNNINNPEWIWGAFVQDDQGDTFGSYMAQIALDANTTYMRGAPKRINQILYDWIPTTDIRKTMWEPAPTTTNFPLPTTAFVRQPYMSRKFKIRALPTIGDVPYIRLAEMYLILAEANARIGRESQAQQALFTLAKNRNPSYVLSTNTGQNLLNEIYNNKRVEFWGEGHRFFDLKRLNLSLDRTVVPNYVSNSVGGVMQIAAGTNSWQFAIPISELQANTNSTPNP